MMTRRELLATALAPSPSLRDWILVHEHVMVDFVGADRIRPGRYDENEVVRLARPHLEAVRDLGCRRINECTPNFLGRSPRLLHRLQDETGLELWTNTGLYAAGEHRYLPRYAKEESAEQLARRWTDEANRGIEGIKPRFIKIGVNKGPLHEWDRKVVEAAALTSRNTGLTIAAHTGDGAAAREELDIVLRNKVDAHRFVWVHAQNEHDAAIHEELARAGAWVEFDGLNAKTSEWHLACVRRMAGKNLLGQTLISQDSGWYHVGEPGGGDYRGYTYIYTDFVPRLKGDWAVQLLKTNPVKAFGQ